jgi:hypothetical protein
LHCSIAYLGIVQIVLSKRCPDGHGERISRPPKTKQTEFEMSIPMNRFLDVVASYAIVFLGLALTGATAAVGA